jgi:hypothetical protein
MTDHTSISAEEAADRLAIRELVDAYARCADRRDAEGQKALTPVFENLNTYEATTHFNGQSTVALDGHGATGESYCLAHHVYTADGERKLMIASLRYRDTFVKTDGTWRFGERRLYVDWTETRTI